MLVGLATPLPGGTGGISASLNDAVVRCDKRLAVRGNETGVRVLFELVVEIPDATGE